jgi:hypothetical protein
MPDLPGVFLVVLITFVFLISLSAVSVPLIALIPAVAVVLIALLSALIPSVTIPLVPTLMAAVTLTFVLLVALTLVLTNALALIALISAITRVALALRRFWCHCMLLFSGVKKLVVVGRIFQLPAENTKGGLSLSQTVAINGLNFMTLKVWLCRFLLRYWIGSFVVNPDSSTRRR